MKKEPFDSLTEQDKYNIRKYIYLYANCNCGSLDIVLREWNKSKRRLYHAFGNQLSIKKKIILPKDKSLLEKKLHDVYRFFLIRFQSDMNYYKKMFLEQNELSFYEDFFIFITNKEDISFEEKKFILNNLFRYRYIINGYLNCRNFKLENYSFSMRAGCKTIRTIQKCIKALGYRNAELFNQWRNSINTINSNQLNEATLVLSINPIDFMTMSDNKCNWSSCMSWIQDGCYSAGTIEMMNSNVAVVVYLESERPFIITLDENNQLILPNKSWRSLVYCHKNIILTGKSYPYYNEYISKEALKFMRETVEEKFNWHYQFNEQLYGDIQHFYKNSFLKFDCSPTYGNHKRIIIHTKGMYNDLVEDTSFPYWCCRNHVKNGLKLCLSGKHTCMCCGDIIGEWENEQYNSCPEEINNVKICLQCRRYNRCPICDTISWHTDNKYHLCSDDCKKEALIFEGQNSVINKVDFLSNLERIIVIVSNNEKTFKKIQDIVNDIDFGAMNFKQSSRFIEILLSEKNFFKGRDYLIKIVPAILINKQIISTKTQNLFFSRNFNQPSIYLFNYCFQKKHCNLHAYLSLWYLTNIYMIDEYIDKMINDLYTLEYYNYYTKERRRL